MHKIIHSTFELDLSSYNISLVEENYWFSDRFFTKYSFPFNFELTDELIEAFGDLLDDNAKFIETIFNVQYAFGNQLESAVFEIESQIGKNITSKFRYGFDELPNFDKKLSELPLETTTITDIYAHAKTIISQKWPAVNYNYPQIFTDKYDATQKTWENFEGIINNYKDLNFLENTEVSSEFINENIIQPLAYVLYVFQQGFLDAGFTLKGDILTSDLFKKMLLYKEEDYFLLGGDISNVLVNNAIYDIDLDFDEVQLNRALVLVPDNNYRITGTIAIFSQYPTDSSSLIQSYTNVSYKGETLASVDSTILDEVTKEIDVTFTTDSDANTSTQILLFVSGGDENYITSGRTVFDLKIERVLRDKASEVIIYEDLDLTRAVPEITFGKLITEYKKWFNLEVNPVGNDIYINFIEDKLNYNNAVDLTFKEVLKPKKTFNKLDSLILRFNKPNSDAYSFTPVFQNKTNLLYSDLEENKNTESIDIDVLPLPQINRFGLETSFAFDDGGDQKIYVLLYDGLQSDLNTTVDSSCLNLPEVHNKYHKKWFDFRLTAIEYRWLFKMYFEEVQQIDKKVFAYGRYHLIKSIDKTQVSEDLFEVEIEVATLP